MQVDIIADSNKGAYEYHKRMYPHTIDFDPHFKKLVIKAGIDDTIEFAAVVLHDIGPSCTSLKGLTVSCSGIGTAPASRIIRITHI